MVASCSGGSWYEAFTHRYAMHRKTLSLSFALPSFPQIFLFHIFIIPLSLILIFTRNFHTQQSETNLFKKKGEIYPRSCLFAFEIDGKGKFTMDKWLLPRFSSPRRERDPSFQCEKITECSNLREKYFTKNPPRKKTIHFKWKYF